MTPEEQLQALDVRARDQLSHPMGAARIVGIQRPQLAMLVWRFPAFEPYQSWCLIGGGGLDADTWLVRQVTWQRSTDYERATHPLKQAQFMMEPAPVPTTKVVDAPASADLARQIFDQISRLALPSLPMADDIGIDGAVNGLEVQDGHIHIEWWRSGPPAWRAFTANVEQIRLALENHVSPPTCAIR